MDKHLKIDKLLGSVYLSTDSHPIKVAYTAPSNNMRANEIVIETAKTGKVTEVVEVMSIFCIKKSICRALISGMRSFLAKSQKVPISQRKTPAYQETFWGKQENASYQKN